MNDISLVNISIMCEAKYFPRGNHSNSSSNHVMYTPFPQQPPRPNTTMTSAAAAAAVTTQLRIPHVISSSSKSGDSQNNNSSRSYSSITNTAMASTVAVTLRSTNRMYSHKQPIIRWTRLAVHISIMMAAATMATAAAAAASPSSDGFYSRSSGNRNDSLQLPHLALDIMTLSTATGAADVTVSTVPEAYYKKMNHCPIIMKSSREPATKATSGSENLSIITGRRTTGSSSPPQEITAPVSVILNETMKGKYQYDITSSVQLRSLTRFQYFCDHIMCSNIYHHVGGKIVLPQVNELPITLSGLLCK